MSDLLDLQQRAVDEFARRVNAVADDQWQRATPCADWDVRTLVNHLVYEDLWAPHLARGETVQQVGDRYEGDQLGGDPKAAWRDASADAVAAFREPGALERTVHLSYGDETARGYLAQLVTDHVVHAWDLARGIGDDDTLDPDLVAWTLDELRSIEQLVRQSGLFGEPLAVPDTADPQTKLLAFVGRSPSG
ncbi:MAG: TIGR03086 family protein [Actinobacteria bacterium]|nr:TIGR03086 family protein [Actinomycetota bacterium]